MELTRDTPVQYLPQVGPARAKKLEILGIKTIQDLLYYVPFRYNDFSLVSPINRIQPGETVTVGGEVTAMHAYSTKTGRSVQEAIVTDKTESVRAIWFNQTYLLRVIKPGMTIHVAGQVAWFGNKIAILSPQYEINYPDSDKESLHTGRLVPVYSETEGLTSKWLRARIAYALDQMIPKATDALTENIRSHFHLLNVQTALRQVHFPAILDRALAARRRLAFDELLMYQLLAFTQRRHWEKTHKAQPLTIPRDDVASLVASLPFVLTKDQQQALDEIFTDLGKTVPMNRLLEGDVGSGKTVVAAIAMYVAYRNGFSSILMAPTQILAQQHYQTISQLFKNLSIPVGLVTSELKTGVDNTNLHLFSKSTGTAVIIGTHALLSYPLKNHAIGLVVVDEQHRFGVEQRTKLLMSQQGISPHLLTMTATPIPRTVARIIFGNLDLSVLQELPKGRKAVKTWVVPTAKRDNAYAWISKQIRETGGQAFIICPLIEESQSESLSSVKAVTTEYKRLQKIFAEFQLGLLHGRLNPKEKTAVLESFRSNKVQILVTTPVVEVGIDVPNATIMLIETADRFGLGQLHQLRGRVGRGQLPSYCLLFTETEEERAIKRLKALETIFNGPELAEVDLALRGPGEIFGKRQHGIPELKIADFTDTKLIGEVREAVKLLTESDPELTQAHLLREQLKKSTIEGVSFD